VRITLAEGAKDSLRVFGMGGNDTVNAAGLRTGVLTLTLDGGDGEDTLTGSAGNDLVASSRGSDTAFLGAGNDVFVWNPGDSSDIVEGQGGTDTLQFNGAVIGENFDLSANGSRLRLTRNVATVTMDVNGVEQVNLLVRGGNDNITINDLSRTAVSQVFVDLAGIAGTGTGDGSPDTVVVLGTEAADVITVAGGANGTSVLGLHATLNIVGAEAANDQLIVRARGGDDAIEASSLLAGAIRLRSVENQKIQNRCPHQSFHEKVVQWQSINTA
jgi:hypothetical protein